MVAESYRSEERTWLVRLHHVRLTSMAFQAVSEGAQSLFLRLFRRRGPWFRAASLTYADVPDTSSALKELCDGRLVQLLAETPSAGAKPRSHMLLDLLL